MKITIVTGAFFPVPPIMGGAVEKVWFALGQEFAKRGHSVVHVSRAHPKLPGHEFIAGVTHIRVRGFDQPRSIVWLKFLDLVYSWRVRRVLPAADILVSNTFWLPLLERRRHCGLVYVHVARRPKFQMALYRNAARLQPVSQSLAETIIAQAPQFRAKVRAIPNPLPFPLDGGTGSTRDRTILFVGRIHPEKGIELLLRAMAALSEDAFSDWRLKMVGPHETQYGGGGSEFLSAMQNASSQGRMRVEWSGAIFDEAELRAQYRSATIFVYPSIAERGEAFGIAPLEAMAHGCVPVVSDLPVFREYIDNGVNGFVFDHRSNHAAQDLADCLKHLLCLDRDELGKIADATRAKAAEFAVERVAQRYLDDFESLLAQTRK